MTTTIYKGLEFLLIFIILPVSLVLHYPLWIKMFLCLMGFVYVIYVLLKVENNKFKMAAHLHWNAFWKQTFFKGVAIAILTTALVYITDKSALFHVMLHKPLLWFIIVFAYSVFSVYPQELIYRTLYFQRYKSLFKSDALFVFLNAIVFSLAHLMFKNTLVLIITFLGGLLFALTYIKTKSTVLVTIEHAIYGSWLFTVGMGGMLGFPS